MNEVLRTSGSVKSTGTLPSGVWTPVDLRLTSASAIEIFINGTSAAGTCTTPILVARFAPAAPARFRRSDLDGRAAGRDAAAGGAELREGQPHRFEH